MAWTAPKTWTVGEFVTKAMLDEQIRDNMAYLKGEADKHATVSHSSVEGSRAIDTVYQNTSGKLMLVAIEVKCQTSGAGDASYAMAQIGTADPPNKKAGGWGFEAVSMIAYATLTFLVPVSWYYRLATTKAGSGATPVMIMWSEWELL